ncbi:hypothetical protein Dimus_035344 [Dionaea muscipula]
MDLPCTIAGKKIVKLEICSGQNNRAGNIKSAERRATSSSVLEIRLDELRKELASIHGGIFPHSVLSTQQISMLADQKPDTLEQLECIIGKVKTDKYGSRILEEITHPESKQPDGVTDDGQEIKERAPKKMKTKKALVVIEIKQ